MKPPQRAAMGLLRLLLALGVVRDHKPFFESFFLVKGGFAVILFYIISGFYMSLVITENYSKLGKGWEKKFLLNRALRLYPAYWVVLIFTIIVMAAMATPTVFTSDLNLSSVERGLAIFSNTFIAGLDVLVSGSILHWHEGPGGLAASWQIYPVFVGWTVGVELTFYVLAAFFILRGRRTAMLALALGAYIRIWLLLVNGKDLGFIHDGLGYSNEPWGYHFFGANLIFFMFGYVAYEIYVYLRDRLKNDAGFIRWVQIGTAALAGILVIEAYLFNGYQTIADYNDHAIWMTIPFFVLLVGPLFLLTKRSVIDNFLGLFSYPIYLCHYIVTTAVVYFFKLPDNRFTTLLCVAAGSLILVFAVDKPVDAFRHRLTFGKKNAVAAPPPQVITAPATP